MGEYLLPFAGCDNKFTSPFDRLYLRPTEYDGIFSCTVFGRQVDFSSLFEEDHQALFAHIRRVSAKPELQFGKVKWLSEWKLVPFFEAIL